MSGSGGAVGAPLPLEVCADTGALALRAARRIAAAARRAVTERGIFHLAVSGGRTPLVMLRRLAELPVPWTSVHLWQADERAAPDDDPARNWTALCDALLERAPIAAESRHPMPVTDADLEAAAARYAAELAAAAGTPPVLDLVHLGLGADGHTASLVPGDTVLEVSDRDVAPTGLYQGHRRLTLTYPLLERAREILFLVAGADKAGALTKLQRRDPSIPAGRLWSERIAILADRAAAGA
ncbi:MAG: 6-phosphogluconolactonase [Planctomycetes bacterium]|nr:6-phosphogluconolactonase [Planctomycetota bacterium]